MLTVIFLLLNETIMNNHHQPPVFALPTADNPKRTLVIARGLGLLFFASLLVAGGWRYAVNRSEAKNLEQRTVESLTRSVIATHSHPGETTRKIVLPASLRGNTEAQIYARTNGYLNSWHKTIGDQVKKDELLAEIDVPELEQELAQGHAAIAQIKVRLDLAQSTLKRWNQLKATDSVIQQDYDEKRSAAKQAQVDLAAAEVNVKRLEKVAGYRHIIAPFSGVVTRRAVDVGSLVNAGTQELFALTQINPLRLTVWVPQVYADDVKTGQEVSVRIGDAQGKTVTAHIDHVAGALDPVNRSRQVDITLPNPDGKLLPGAYVETTINIVGKASPLVVPVNVLVIDQVGTHVVVVGADNHVTFKPVKLGRDFGREVEILEGIAANDVLVASPSDLLVEGEAVKVVEAKEKSKDKAKTKS
jgi:RND family efflux transporter MFP subunit